MTLRDDLHRLIDELPEAQLGDAPTLLEALRAKRQQVWSSQELEPRNRDGRYTAEPLSAGMPV
jgi:hypothetical protein